MWKIRMEVKGRTRKEVRKMNMRREIGVRLVLNRCLNLAKPSKALRPLATIIRTPVIPTSSNNSSTGPTPSAPTNSPISPTTTSQKHPSPDTPQLPTATPTAGRKYSSPTSTIKSQGSSARSTNLLPGHEAATEDRWWRLRRSRRYIASTISCSRKIRS